MKQTSHNPHFGSITSYILGFSLSIVITLLSYFVVTSLHLENTLEIIVVLSLAIIQLIVQLIFFLHLSQEKKPRWNLIFFTATIGMMLLVVIASIWIMSHLNYNMMPAQMDKVLMRDEGIKK